MPTVIFLSFVTVVAGYNLLTLPEIKAQESALVADRQAVSMLTYKGALVSALEKNPITDGVLPTYQLPQGWFDTLNWRHRVSGGTLYIYEAQPQNNPELINTLLVKTNRSITVGQSFNCVYQDAVLNVSGNLPVDLCRGAPPPIPNGAIVVIGL